MDRLQRILLSALIDGHTTWWLLGLWAGKGKDWRQLLGFGILLTGRKKEKENGSGGHFDISVRYAIRLFLFRP